MASIAQLVPINVVSQTNNNIFNRLIYSSTLNIHYWRISQLMYLYVRWRFNLSIVKLNNIKISIMITSGLHSGDDTAFSKYPKQNVA